METQIKLSVDFLLDTLGNNAPEFALFEVDRALSEGRESEAAYWARVAVAVEEALGLPLPTTTNTSVH